MTVVKHKLDPATLLALVECVVACQAELSPVVCTYPCLRYPHACRTGAGVSHAPLSFGLIDLSHGQHALEQTSTYSRRNSASKHRRMQVGCGIAGPSLAPFT